MSTSGYFSFAIGIGAQNKNGEWLDVYYQQPLLNPSETLISAAAAAVGHKGGNAAISLSTDQLSALAKALQDAAATAQAELATKLLNTEQPVVVTFVENDEAPASVPEAYLKLHLLTHRLVKPHNELGWEQLLNRRGTTWRKLPESDRDNISESTAIALMLAQPAMIKRPLLDTGSQRLLGFKAAEYEHFLSNKQIQIKS